ncbi:hypothetical protein ABPG77_006953 [Micractinium sp. CCAP 211/92]
MPAPSVGHHSQEVDTATSYAAAAPSPWCTQAAADNLSSWSTERLRQYCRDRGQYAGGSRQDVEERMQGFLRYGTPLDSDDDGHVPARPRAKGQRPQADSQRSKPDLADLATWDTERLRQYCRDRGQYAGGSRQDVEQRVRNCMLYGTPHDSDEEQQEEEADADNLSTWDTERLRQYCRDRGQYAGGSRQDVEQRVRNCMLYGTPHDSDEEQQEEEADADNLSTWDTERLRQYCRDRGQYAGGSRQDVEQRVRNCMLYGTPHDSDEEQQEEEADADNLSTWDTERLRQYCRDRGQYAGGSRQDVEQRVRNCMLYGTPHDSDEEQQEEEADADNLSTWDTERLRQYCRDRGQYAGGSRQDVEQRVRNCMLYGTPHDSDEEQQEEEADADNLSTWDTERLRQYCRDRGQYAGGSRQDVEQRVRNCMLYGTPHDSDEEQQEEEADADNLSTWDTERLRQYCRDRGQYAGGSRQDVEQRVRNCMLYGTPHDSDEEQQEEEVWWGWAGHGCRMQTAVQRLSERSGHGGGGLVQRGQLG